MGSKGPFESKNSTTFFNNYMNFVFGYFQILFSNSKVIVNENVNAKQNEYRSSMGLVLG
jgi:hypothetical protein